MRSPILRLTTKLSKNRVAKGAPISAAVLCFVFVSTTMSSPVHANECTAVEPFPEITRMMDCRAKAAQLNGQVVNWRPTATCSIRYTKDHTEEIVYQDFGTTYGVAASIDDAIRMTLDRCSERAAALGFQGYPGYTWRDTGITTLYVIGMECSGTKVVQVCE